MKLEAKATLMLVATLAVGVVLGMFGQGLLMQDRSRRVVQLRKPPGFVRQMEEAIEPRDDQLDTVRKILKAAASRNEAIYEADRQRLGAALDTMRRQLAPLLDKDQQERLWRVSQLPDPNRPPRDDNPRRDDSRPPRKDDEGARGEKRPPRDDENPPPRADNRPPRRDDDRLPPPDDRRPPPRDEKRPPPPEDRPPRTDPRPPANP